MLQGNRRETRLLGILSFVHSTVWKVLFGKVNFFYFLLSYPFLLKHLSNLFDYTDCFFGGLHFISCLLVIVLIFGLMLWRWEWLKTSSVQKEFKMVIWRDPFLTLLGAIFAHVLKVFHLASSKHGKFKPIFYHFL